MLLCSDLGSSSLVSDLGLKGAVQLGEQVFFQTDDKGQTHIESLTAKRRVVQSNWTIRKKILPSVLSGSPLLAGVR